MSQAGSAALRCCRAELIRTAGSSRLWTVFVPVALAVPLAISAAIAAIAERFARIPGQLTVLQVSTSNAAYWVISITVVVAAVAAAAGQSSETSSYTGQYLRLAVPRRWIRLAGNWMFYGALAAALALVATLAVLTILPVLAGSVYGTVSVGDPSGRRLLWATPVYAFFAAGAGVSVGALIASPVASSGLILFWAYVIEDAAGYLPNGASVQQFMPGLNATFATGQDIVLRPPWGPNLALAYVCVVFTSLFLIAALDRK